MFNKSDKNAIRVKRHKRMRTNHVRPISGTAEVPRLNVYRSLSHIYAQIIDDVAGVTLVSANTVEKIVAAEVAGKTKTEASKVIGKLIAERAAEKGITTVVFDRGGYLYTGRVTAVAEAARAAGLEF